MLWANLLACPHCDSTYRYTAALNKVCHAPSRKAKNRMTCLVTVVRLQYFALLEDWAHHHPNLQYQAKNSKPGCFIRRL